MPATQFSLTMAAGGADASVTLGLERGRLLGVCCVPENDTLAPGDTFVALYLLSGGETLNYAVARLGNGYVTALDGPEWSGNLKLQSGMYILARGQSIAGSSVRIGIVTEE